MIPQEEQLLVAETKRPTEPPGQTMLTPEVSIHTIHIHIHMHILLT